MAPLVLEGDTLGQRRRYYNKLVKAATDDQATELLPLNYDDPDVDNLLRIDVACSRRNVQYVLDVLQSDDMLYVSRAIKRSTWLITDDRYAHIVNPEYLNNELFPKMTSKAKNKLMLAIRLNLKKESRVEEFYQFYSDNITVSQKWLPRCSIATIEKVYKSHARNITSDTFKRLCETSFEALKILLSVNYYHYTGCKLKASKILLSKYPDKYYEHLKTIKNQVMPMFGIRATRQLMKHCPDKLTNDFQLFANYIHIPTFAKCLKKEDIISDFLLKQSENIEMKSWIHYDHIKHFVKYIPIDTRFQFIKKVLIHKEKTPNASIYCWYRFAAFDAAFVDLKNLIRAESSPAERNSMLKVLIDSGCRNQAHIKTLLQFYRDKHINEPFKFKVQFVNSLLSYVETHKFEVETWGILNDIFSSMEVYIESENSVPYCIKAIIVYKLLHNEDIPEIIERKHTFDTFKEYRKTLKGTDREKLFEYLYNTQVKKLKNLSINNEVEMTKSFNILEEALTLLKDWNKRLSDYPEINNNIKLCINAIRDHPFKNNLSFIYKQNKKWRKDLFEESLLLKPDDDACVRALKYDPGLLERYSAEVSAMCFNDAVSLKRTLLRLRIYWAQSLAQKWTDRYLEGLQKPTGHKAISEGLCILLPRKEFQSLVEKYAPNETKIDWSNIDHAQLSLQKNIAKQIKLIRPYANLEAVLLYAKDDYLQFALPSLNFTLSNMSVIQFLKILPLLTDAPVSLRKHGIRFAFAKLKVSEVRELLEDLWKNTKNSSIKTLLFKKTFKLFKNAKTASSIKELWELLSVFIDNMSNNENKVIYENLGKVEDVPLLVRHEFIAKSYACLSSLQTKAHCEPVIKHLKNNANEIVHLLDPSFVENFLLKPVPEFVSFMTGQTDGFMERLNSALPLLTSYIVHSESEEAQYAKYERCLMPVLTYCFESWNTIKDGRLIVRQNVHYLLRQIAEKFKSAALNKTNSNSLLSEIYTKMLKDIETKLRTLPIEKNYILITYWSIAVLFAESFNMYMKKTPKPNILEKYEFKNDCPPDFRARIENDVNWKNLCSAVAPFFGKLLVDYIKLDIVTQHTSLVTFFTRSLKNIFDHIQIHPIARCLTLKHMLNSDVPVTHMVALEASYMYFSKDEEVLALKREIQDIIKANPSVDVQIHFNEVVCNDPDYYDDSTPYCLK